MNLREMTATSVLRKYRRVDSWFISMYGMNRLSKRVKEAVFEILETGRSTLYHALSPCNDPARLP
jgi:hypothetical protein